MKQGVVRIIAGKWRSRSIKIADEINLRPTPDRVRETLFNWLTPYIPGAKCLDLFAGTGALGFEALSRGASSVVMMEENLRVITELKTQAQLLNAENIVITKATLPQDLTKLSEKFDIVFIDPPYKNKLLPACCECLEAQNLLADTAYIYLEDSNVIEHNALPHNWQIIKAKKAGQVYYHLAKRELHL